MKIILQLSLSVFFGISATAADAPLKDNFQRNELGSAWTVPAEYKSNFKLENNAVKITSEKSNPLLLSTENKWSNATLKLQMERQGYASFVILFNVRLPAFYRLEITEPGKGQIKLEKSGTDGKIEILKTAIYKDRINEYNRMDVTVNANEGKIEVLINGQPVLKYTDEKPYTRGGIGLGGTWFSNFKVSGVEVITAVAKAPTVTHTTAISDLFVRPEIKDGCFFLQGKPQFMLGVNDTSNFWEFVPRNSEPPFEKNDLLTDLMDRRRAAQLGINSDHVYTRARQVADKCLDELGLNSTQADLLLGNPYRQHWQGREKHRENLKGLPLVVDFSSLWLDICFDQGVKKRVEKAGVNNEICHSSGFLPYNPEDPLGKKIYEVYFREGARHWLNAGNSNPWIYELTNEVQWYYSTHPANRAMFVQWLRGKYGNDLDKLHAAWKDTRLKTFEQAEKLVVTENRAAYGEWMMFLGDRFVDFFRDGVKTIKTVDSRKNVYFDIEISVSSLWFANNGIDYYKLMKTADLFGTEGGVPFGIFKAKKVSYLEEVMNTKRTASMFYYDLSSTFAQGKPIMNQESYICRSHGELGAVPTRRGDFPTLLWFEVFHNYSGSQIYCWWKGGRDFDWKTLDDAKKEARKNPPALGNPYTYPLESLKGIQDFRQEIDRLADVALPGPKARKDIAVLYSTPTIWRQVFPVASAGQKYNYQGHCYLWYETLQRMHAPTGVICEQELNESGAGAYKAIVVPYSKYVFPETVASLEKFARNGGTVIVSGGSLLYNHLANPLNASALLGLERPDDLPEKSAGKIKLSDGNTVEAAAFNAIELTTAKTLTSYNTKKQPCLTVNALGKGKVYYVGIEDLDIGGLEKILQSLLRDSGYAMPWKIENIDGSPLPEVEVQCIRRADQELYFLCNWDGRKAVVAKFYPDAANASRIFVTDAVKQEPYASAAPNHTWTNEELKAGVTVLLPSQERVLIAVSSAQPSVIATKSWTAERCKSELQSVQQKLDAELSIYDRELNERETVLKAEYENARKGYAPEAKKCQSLDLRQAANMGFKDEAANDGKGGWTDQGAMDLREFPLGARRFSGVPFSIIDPATNNGRSCIILKGTLRQFPKESIPIMCRQKVKALYFLHASAYGGRAEKHLDYKVTYADGTELAVPIEGGKEISDWYEPKAVTNGYIAWEGANPLTKHIGVYCSRWLNPQPEKEVSSVTAISAGSEAVPGVIAITAESIN